MRRSARILLRGIRRAVRRATASRAPGEGFTALRELQRHFDRTPAPPVLYFGDSVVERISRDDADRRTLGELVVERMGGAEHCTCISHSAYHPAMFAALLRAVQRVQSQPRLVILPVNMRCFSPQWDHRPAYQFTKEISAIERFIADPSAPQETVEPMVESREDLAAYDSISVRYPSSALSRIGDFRRIVESTPQTESERAYRLEQIFKFHYTHALTPGHRKLRALLACCESIRDMNARALLYITPINYQAGSRYAGPTFLPEYQRSVAVLLDALARYEREGQVTVVDWSTLLESRYFVQPDIANEHLNYSGRMRLANEIARNCPALG